VQFRQHHVAILVAFGLSHVDHHAFAIDVPGGQPDHLRDAQPRRIDGDEDRAHHQVGLSLDEREHLVLRQHCWQRVFRAGVPDLVGQRLVAECRSVEEAQGSTIGLIEGAFSPRDKRCKRYSRTCSMPSLSGEVRWYRAKQATA
jgi:hypothetical protein